MRKFILSLAAFIIAAMLFPGLAGAQSACDPTGLDVPRPGVNVKVKFGPGGKDRNAEIYREDINGGMIYHVRLAPHHDFEFPNAGGKAYVYPDGCGWLADQHANDKSNRKTVDELSAMGFFNEAGGQQPTTPAPAPSTPPSGPNHRDPVAGRGGVDCNQTSEVLWTEDKIHLSGNPGEGWAIIEFYFVGERGNSPERYTYVRLGEGQRYDVLLRFNGKARFMPISCTQQQIEDDLKAHIKRRGEDKVRQERDAHIEAWQDTGLFRQVA